MNDIDAVEAGLYEQLPQAFGPECLIGIAGLIADRDAQESSRLEHSMQLNQSLNWFLPKVNAINGKSLIDA